MADVRHVTVGGKALAVAASLGVGLAGSVAAAADLPRYEAQPRYEVVPAPPRGSVYGYGSFGLDPGPASSSGYYGYYGFDIGGTPYNGLYSANVVCLRSVATPAGYETVNVCHPD